MLKRPPSSALSRRGLLAASSALLPTAMLWMPGVGRAVEPSARRFLFVFAQGGWDQTCLFAPLFGAPNIDMEVDAVEANAHGIPYVQHEGRPSVTTFMERYGDRTCFINGFEVRSVAHDACVRLAMTGTSLPSSDDWPSLIAASTGADLLLPLIHLSGPSFTYDRGSAVVRVGSSGQLPDLISGDVFLRADQALSLPPASQEALEDAFVTARVNRLAVAAGRGREKLLLDRSVGVQDRMDRIGGLADSLRFGSSNTLTEGMDLLVNAFANDLARCGMVRHVGWKGLGWDTHSNDFQQALNFEELFDAIVTTMETLDSLPGKVERTLAEEVTIVVMSEMGRYPQYNYRGGKDHWTYTSCLLVGAGVAGGQAIGAYDESCGGEKVDLLSGETTESGVSLLPDHIGATLLTLAGVDSEALLPGVEPVHAAIS